MQEPLNRLVLMAGASSAFQDGGSPYPKNLVEVAGRSLFEQVLDPIGRLSGGRGRLICLVGEDECKRWHTEAAIRLQYPEAALIQVRTPTGGAACTALLAIDLIDNDDQLVVSNGDIIIQADLDGILAEFAARNLDAGVIVFEDIHPRWSFVKIDEHGLVTEAAEKRPISKLATSGFFYFRHGQDFVSSVREMLAKDANVDGSFYVCPALNQMVLQQRRIGVHQIAKSDYFSLKDPQGVLAYESWLKK